MTAPVLLIGGLDSSGGAGLLRDAAATHEFGVASRVAATAVTAQDDQGMYSSHPIPSEVVAAQIQTAGVVGGIKIGMLAQASTVRVVAEGLPCDVPVVLDPVLRSSSGFDLIDRRGLDALIGKLLRHVTVLTPNLPELASLGAALGRDRADERGIVLALQAAGVREVLVKGGHAGGAELCEDRLHRADGSIMRFSGPRFPFSMRGTGCQLASSIAAALSRNICVPDAVAAARRAVEARFRSATPCVPVSQTETSSTKPLANLHPAVVQVSPVKIDNCSTHGAQDSGGVTLRPE